MHEQVWLICERTLGKESVRKFQFSYLPASIGRKLLVATNHERWAIEQHYRDIKHSIPSKDARIRGCIAT